MFILTALVIQSSSRKIEWIITQEFRLVGLLLVEQLEQPGERIVSPIAPLAFSALEPDPAPGALSVSASSSALLPELARPAARLLRTRCHDARGLRLLATVASAHVHQIFPLHRRQVLPGLLLVAASTLLSPTIGLQVMGT